MPALLPSSFVKGAEELHPSALVGAQWRLCSPLRTGVLRCRIVQRNVRLYSTLICPYCIRAKLLLRERGIPYDEVDVTGDSEKRAWLAQETGRRTVPQIFVDDESIGGFDELRSLDRSGELSRKLAA